MTYAVQFFRPVSKDWSDVVLGQSFADALSDLKLLQSRCSEIRFRVVREVIPCGICGKAALFNSALCRQCIAECAESDAMESHADYVMNEHPGYSEYDPEGFYGKQFIR